VGRGLVFFAGNAQNLAGVFPAQSDDGSHNAVCGGIAGRTAVERADGGAGNEAQILHVLPLTA